MYAWIAAHLLRFVCLLSLHRNHAAAASSSSPNSHSALLFGKSTRHSSFDAALIYGDSEQRVRSFRHTHTQIHMHTSNMRSNSRLSSNFSATMAVRNVFGAASASAASVAATALVLAFIQCHQGHWWLVFSS